MRVGMLISDVPAGTPPEQQFRDLLRIVEAGQKAGLSYFAIGQHFLYGDLRWLQPIPVLARLAAEVDPHVRLVTQIIIPTLYHPVILAEELATLDIVTEGRLIVGVGLGYRLEEFDYLGIPRERRGQRLDEAIRLMKAVWTEDEVDFDGEFWQVKDARPHIRPVQQPHPPIWVGAHGLPGRAPRRPPRRRLRHPARDHPRPDPRALRDHQGRVRQARQGLRPPVACAATSSSPTPTRTRSSSTPASPRAATSPTPSAAWTSTPATRWRTTSSRRSPTTPCSARPTRSSPSSSTSPRASRSTRSSCGRSGPR